MPVPAPAAAAAAASSGGGRRQSPLPIALHPTDAVAATPFDEDFSTACSLSLHREPLLQRLLACRTCALAAVCSACARSCHRGHILARHAKDAGTAPFGGIGRVLGCCGCGAGPSCRAAPLQPSGGTDERSRYESSQRLMLAAMQWYLSAAMDPRVAAALDRVDDESGGVVAHEIAKLARSRDPSAPEIGSISSLARTLVCSPFIRFNKLHSERLRLSPRHPHAHAVLALVAQFVAPSHEGWPFEEGSSSNSAFVASSASAATAAGGPLRARAPPLGPAPLDDVIDPVVLALWGLCDVAFERPVGLFSNTPPGGSATALSGFAAGSSSLAAVSRGVWVPRLVARRPLGSSAPKEQPCASGEWALLRNLIEGWGGGNNVAAPPSAAAPAASLVADTPSPSVPSLSTSSTGDAAAGAEWWGGAAAAAGVHNNGFAPIGEAESTSSAVGTALRSEGSSEEETWSLAGIVATVAAQEGQAVAAPKRRDTSGNIGRINHSMQKQQQVEDGFSDNHGGAAPLVGTKRDRSTGLGDLEEILESVDDSTGAPDDGAAVDGAAAGPLIPPHAPLYITDGADIARAIGGLHDELVRCFDPRNARNSSRVVGARSTAGATAAAVGAAAAGEDGEPPSGPSPVSPQQLQVLGLPHVGLSVYYELLDAPRAPSTATSATTGTGPSASGPTLPRGAVTLIALGTRGGRSVVIDVAACRASLARPGPPLQGHYDELLLAPSSTSSPGPVGLGAFPPPAAESVAAGASAAAASGPDSSSSSSGRATLKSAEVLFSTSKSASAAAQPGVSGAGKRGLQGGSALHDSFEDADLSDRLRRCLSPLSALLLDPRVVKIAHNGSGGLMWLQQHLGLHVVNLFDTFVALDEQLIARCEGLRGAVYQAESGISGNSAPSQAWRTGNGGSAAAPGGSGRRSRGLDVFLFTESLAVAAAPSLECAAGGAATATSAAAAAGRVASLGAAMACFLPQDTDDAAAPAGTGVPGTGAQLDELPSAPNLLLPLLLQAAREAVALPVLADGVWILGIGVVGTLGIGLSGSSLGAASVPAKSAEAHNSVVKQGEQGVAGRMAAFVRAATATTAAGPLGPESPTFNAAASDAGPIPTAGASSAPHHPAPLTLYTGMSQLRVHLGSPSDPTAAIGASALRRALLRSHLQCLRVPPYDAYHGGVLQVPCQAPPWYSSCRRCGGGGHFTWECTGGAGGVYR